MSKILSTKWFLALVLPCFLMTDHVMVKLTFEGKVGFAYLTLKLPIPVDVLVQGKSAGGTKELLTLFAL